METHIKIDIFKVMFKLKNSNYLSKICKVFIPCRWTADELASDRFLREFVADVEGRVFIRELLEEEGVEGTRGSGTRSSFSGSLGWSLARSCSRCRLVSFSKSLSPFLLFLILTRLLDSLLLLLLLLLASARLRLCAKFLLEPDRKGIPAKQKIWEMFD